MKTVQACALLAVAFVTLAVRAHEPSVIATRYECHMLDGSIIVTPTDLADRFRKTVRVCTTLDAAQLPMDVLSSMPRVRSPEDMSDDLETDVTPVRAPKELQQLLSAASERYGLDVKLVSAMVHVESRYQVNARSPKGALGLMQIMPATGLRYGAATPGELLDPAKNVDVGSRYLRDLHDMFDGRLELVLAAYNAGEGAVRRYGNRIPPYNETREYVKKVMRLYRASS